MTDPTPTAPDQAVDPIIPPLTHDEPPAPLSPTVPLNPPMVGVASPFDHIDGQNRDAILEAIRSWGRGPLRDWTGAWQSYLVKWLADTQNWLVGWDESITAWVRDQIADADERLDEKIAELAELVAQAVQDVINAGITVSDPVIAGVLSNANTLTNAILDARYARIENVRVEADIAPALARIVARGGGALRVPYGVKLNLSSTIVRPPELREFIIDGSIVQTADVPVMVSQGTVGAAVYPVTVTPTAGSRVATVESTSGLAVGDIVMIASNDVIPGSPDRLAYLRRVRSLSSTVVTFDTSLPRSMPAPDNRRLRKINMAPPILVSGVGDVSYADPMSKTATMFRFVFTESPVVKGPFLHDGGGICMSVSHCMNADMDTRIDRFIDDLDNNHVGYGVNVGGATRDSVIAGHISRCRHAVTTGPGPDLPEFSFGGEPENNVFKPITAHCTNKAIDTHRAGWGNRIIAQDTGSGGAVQVRADNTFVESIVAHGNFAGDVLTIDPLVMPWSTTVGPILASGGTSAVIFSGSHFYLTAFPRKLDGPGDLFRLQAGVTYSASSQAMTAQKTADQMVNNSTALVDAVDLALPVEANARYLLSAFLVYRASTTADIRFKFDGPAGVNVSWITDGSDTAVTTPIPAGVPVRRTPLAVSDDQIVGGIGASASIVATPVGRVVTAATAGTLKLQFAQGAAEATDTTLRVGSWLRLERIA